MIKIDRIKHFLLKYALFRRLVFVDNMDEVAALRAALADLVAVAHEGKSWRHDTVNYCRCKGCAVQRAKEILKGGHYDGKK